MPQLPFSGHECENLDEAIVEIDAKFKAGEIDYLSRIGLVVRYIDGVSISENETHLYPVHSRLGVAPAKGDTVILNGNRRALVVRAVHGFPGKWFEATAEDYYTPASRSLRYGKLVRGWDWRTTPELLEKAEAKRKELNLNRTEFLEKAINHLIEND